MKQTDELNHNERTDLPPLLEVFACVDWNAGEEQEGGGDEVESSVNADACWTVCE